MLKYCVNVRYIGKYSIHTWRNMYYMHSTHMTTMKHTHDDNNKKNKKQNKNKIK